MYVVGKYMPVLPVSTTAGRTGRIWVLVVVRGGGDVDKEDCDEDKVDFLVLQVLRVL